MKAAAIIVASGSGKRMGGTENKLLLEICGEPVIDRTLRAFSLCRAIDAIILVTSDCLVAARAKSFPKVIMSVDGGETRAQSVQKGLQAAEGFDIVAVHDGARPLVSDEIICAVLREAERFGAAVTGTDMLDTVKRTDIHGNILETPPRASLRAVQTPQAFSRELLMDAYRRFPEGGTDDASVAEAAKSPVKVVAGSRENIKITTPFDILLAETILKARTKICE